MTNPDPLIEAVDLSHVSHTTEAVAGISFSARRGEIFGLPGAGGAGRTSAGPLARCLPSSWSIPILTRRDLRGNE